MFNSKLKSFLLYTWSLSFSTFSRETDAYMYLIWTYWYYHGVCYCKLFTDVLFMHTCNRCWNRNTSIFVFYHWQIFNSRWIFFLKHFCKVFFFIYIPSFMYSYKHASRSQSGLKICWFCYFKSSLYAYIYVFVVVQIIVKVGIPTKTFFFSTWILHFFHE